MNARGPSAPRARLSLPAFRWSGTGRNTRCDIPSRSGIPQTSTADIAPLETAGPWVIAPFGAGRCFCVGCIQASSHDAAAGRSTRSAVLRVVCPSCPPPRHCGRPHCGRPHCGRPQWRGVETGSACSPRGPTDRGQMRLYRGSAKGMIRRSFLERSETGSWLLAVTSIGGSL